MKAKLKKAMEFRVSNASVGGAGEYSLGALELPAGTEVSVLSTKKSMGRALVKYGTNQFSVDLADLELGEVVQ